MVGKANGFISNYGFTKAAYWVKIDLNNNLHTDQKIGYYILNILNGYFADYTPNAQNQYRLRTTGDAYAFSGAPLKTWVLRFLLVLLHHPTNTVFVCACKVVIR
ncbi:MAG: hypothetical protein IPM78_01845 [Moraxellaceae bacterium]|nr:hypothetical protein [Moraxellaceae bacterium]